MLTIERTDFPVNARLRHETRGFGVVEGMQGRYIRVRFDGEADITVYNPLSAPIDRMIWSEGDQVLVRNLNVVGVVTHVGLDGAIAVYRVRVPGKDRPLTVPEAGLSDAPGLEWPDELLAAGRFGDPKQFYFRTLAHYLESARHQVGMVGLAARIEPMPHQAFVAQRVVDAPQPRFLLADEVGLGKTIETGLILQELRARGGLDRVLIVVPPNLATQWLYELSSKFNESFKLFTTKSQIAQEQAKHPLVNVWETAGNIITTHSYISGNPHTWSEIASVHWDMIVFDEAHHLRRQRDSGNRMSITTLYRFASQVSQRTRGLLLLTATPMQLDPFELFSLVELLDPALFYSYEFFEEQRKENRTLNMLLKQLTEFTDLSPVQQEVTINSVREMNLEAIDSRTIAEIPHQQRSRDRVVEALAERHLLGEVMIRNRKRLIGGFTRRIPHVIAVTLSPAELNLYRDLADFVRLAYRSVPADRQRFIVGFMLVGYQKRLTSSLHGFRLSLQRRIKRLEQGEVKGGTFKLTPDDITELDVDKITGTFTDMVAFESQAGESIDELRLLRQLLAQAQTLPRDTKYEALETTLEALFAQVSHERVVIFTQFLDTLLFLEEHLAKRWKVGAFHGGLTAAQKDAAIGSFQKGETRILVSTEAGGEGRNLQVASVLVNYDLPWNPMKVEQRIGRLDRIGQAQDVRIFNFAIAGTVEERVLDVLHRRIHAFEETVGGLDPILGTMERDIQTILLESDPDRLDAELAAYADHIDVATARAREADDVLRDFALDRRSFDSRMQATFDSDEQSRIMRHANKLSKSLLKQVGARFAPIGDDIYRLQIGKRVEMDMPAGIREVYQITFNHRQAAQEDLVEFGTFGHPLFDALLAYATSDDFGGLTAARTLVNATHAGFQGFQFNILVTISSFKETQKVIVVPVAIDGTIRPDLSSYLLDAFDWRNDPQPFESGDVPDWAERVSNARSLAEDWVETRLAEEMAALRSRRQEEHKAERKKIDRYCMYRAQEGRRKVEHDELILARLRESERAEDQRVIPAWERTLLNNQERLRQVERDHVRLFTELDQREAISYSYELLNAAWVQIVAPRGGE